MLLFGRVGAGLGLALCCVCCRNGHGGCFIFVSFLSGLTNVSSFGCLHGGIHSCGALVLGCTSESQEE